MKVHFAPPRGKLELVQYEAWLITNGFEPIFINKYTKKAKYPLFYAVAQILVKIKIEII